MTLSFPLPDAIHASRVEGNRFHLEANPENWSLGEWLSAGGILAAIATWCWKKPVKKLINMWQAPDKIAMIDKKLDLILGGVDLATAMSRVTWRAIDRPVWQSDSNGMCVHANPAMLQLLCVQDDEILGNGWLNIVHMDDRDMVDREWSNSIRNKRDFYLKYRWVNSSGESIPIIAHASRLIDNSGHVLGWVGFVSLIDS